MELGRKIRQQRLKAKLTQEQLAEKLGIGPQSVSKWENDVSMPDITSLPLLAEIFGISIDDLFDLSTEQRLNRIENRMDIEEDLPQDVFMEYEEFLKEQMSSEQYGKRALELRAYLYWHRMDTYARKCEKYASEAVRLSPDEKGCQWMLQKAAGHAAWDWNINNHTDAVNFYKQLYENNPECRMVCFYLLDNLLADRRVDEAEEVLKHLCTLKDVKPVLCEVYRAHIALARFDAAAADAIIEKMIADDPDGFECMFEAAQYYAQKCDYDKAIACYERSFSLQKRNPRFQDELMAIADIYEIRGDYAKAAETYDRIIDLLQNDWGMNEETELQHARKEKARLFAKI